MRRRVNQKDIADRLGLDRTTVSKILNRDPNYAASDETRRKVFEVAQEIGYDFTSVRRPYRREHPRASLDAVAEFSMILSDGTLYDRGECVVINMSEGGALLSRLRCPKMSIPLASFTVKLTVRDIPELAELTGWCEVVRLAQAADTGEPEIGVRFVDIEPDDLQRIQRFVDSRFGGGEDS